MCVCVGGGGGGCIASCRTCLLWFLPLKAACYFHLCCAKLLNPELPHTITFPFLSVQLGQRCAPESPSLVISNLYDIKSREAYFFFHRDISCVHHFKSPDDFATYFTEGRYSCSNYIFVSSFHAVDVMELYPKGNHSAKTKIVKGSFYLQHLRMLYCYPAII